MTAYDVVFSKQASMRYMQKDAGIGSILKNTRRGIQRAAQQRSIAKEYKKMKKFDARQVDYANRANAMRAASDATLNDAAAQSGWSNLWGNIKGSNQAGKADDLMVRSNDAMKASVRRQMAIEKQLVAQGATPAQARAIMRNNNAQKYLQYGDARGAINLQATRDRRMQAVADGRARQQAAQPAAQPAAQATQQAAQVSQPAVQAVQPAVQTANNALNGGGGFSATFGNATDTMSGNANTVSQHINLNKNFGKAAPRKQTAGTGTTRQGQMTAQQASQAAVQPAAQAAQPAVQAAHASSQPAAQAANNALNGGGFSATFNNATATMSGNTGAMPQAINRNKKRRRAARRKKTGGPVATQQGQMPAQPAAPTPVNNQPATATNAAPQPTAQAGVANSPVATAPQPTAQAAPTNSPVATAPQPTAQAATAPTNQGMSLLEKAQLAGSAANLVMPLMMYQMMGQQQATS